MRMRDKGDKVDREKNDWESVLFHEDVTYRNYDLNLCNFQFFINA